MLHLVANDIRVIKKFYVAKLVCDDSVTVLSRLGLVYDPVI